MFKNTLCCIVALSFLLQGPSTVADENNLRSTQKATGSNNLNVDQSGGRFNSAIINQETTGGNNQVNLEQSQSSNQLMVEQLTFGGSDSNNTLNINQSMSNSINLNQTADLGNNVAEVSQGNNLVGHNEVNLVQYSNGITPNAFGNTNQVHIFQNGYNNKLVGANPGDDNGVYDASEIINHGLAAYQVSEFSYNALSLTQNGDFNVVGLYQYGTGSNTATITQNGNANQVGVYQKNTNPQGDGANVLTVNQNGGANIGISMEVNSGINAIEITQNNVLFNGNALP